MMDVYARVFSKRISTTLLGRYPRLSIGGLDNIIKVANYRLRPHEEGL